MTNSETGGCHGNTVHANETDNYTCLCCSREGAQRSSEEGWLVLPGRSGSSQVRQMQTAGLSVAGHAGLPCSGPALEEGNCPERASRAGQGKVDSPCGVLQLFGGDNFVLPEVGFSGCPQDTEPLSSPRHVTLQLPGLTPLR